MFAKFRKNFCEISSVSRVDVDGFAQNSQIVNFARKIRKILQIFCAQNSQFVNFARKLRAQSWYLRWRWALVGPSAAK